MWKPIKDWPTLTELFFGKGVDPAKYKGSMIPAYLSGKGKKPKVRWTSKRGIGIEEIGDSEITKHVPMGKLKKAKQMSKTSKTKKKAISEVNPSTSKANGKKATSKKLTAKTSKTKSKLKKLFNDLPFEGPQEKR